MVVQASPQAGDFAPYPSVPIGFEQTYTGQTDLSAIDTENTHLTYAADADGNVMIRYSLWGFAYPTEDTWTDEIRAINRMQAALGSLDEETRAIRAHIASLVPCDSGFPVTVDEILNAIGTGHLPQPAFHPGCWMSRGTRSTQPLQVESMRVIETVLQGYLDGAPQASFIERYPYAQGFIQRTYQWLGPIEALTEIQRLLIQRILLPFAFFAKHNEDRDAVFQACFDEGKPGKQLDAQIAALAGLPPIFPNYRREYKEALASLRDPHKRTLYTVAGHIADCVSELSDCHHSTFRRIERWIHSVGTLEWDIPTRASHAEGIRLGRALFGYALGLDCWLQRVPMQFLLLDMGHVDLGFNPANEILRVYAYLADGHSPIKRWLAASLWFTLTLMPPASLYQWGRRHKALLAHAEDQGINVRVWMNSVLEKE
jgi:hypothetical protein